MRKYNDSKYKTVTIMGSFNKDYPVICNTANYFKENGIEVIAPSITTIKHNVDKYAILQTDKSDNAIDLETDFLTKCIEADFVYVCNKEGYLGKTVMLELGYMLGRGQEVFFMEMPVEEKLIIEMTQRPFSSIVYKPDELIRIIKNHNEFSYVDFVGNDLFDRNYKPETEFRLNKRDDEER